MHKVFHILLIILLLHVAPAVGQTQKASVGRLPVLKSALLPGWGEHSYAEASRGYLFNGIEAALWVFAGVAYTTAVSHENDLYYFAAEYGDIQHPQDQSDVFLDRVSKYDSMEEYNEQMLRNRRWDRLYSADAGQYWQWESTDRRIEYFNIKTQRYLWRQRLSYSFGAIALNHLVSAMDALYLKRLGVQLDVKPETAFGTGLRMELHF